MRTITRSFTEGGEEVLSAEIPFPNLRVVWVGDTCTVYEEGDELPGHEADNGEAK